MRKFLSVVVLTAAVSHCGEIASKVRGTGDQESEADAVPRNSYEQFYIHVWNELPIELSIDSAMDEAQLKAIMNAAATWNDAVGYEVLRVSSDQLEDPGFRSVNDLREDGVNSILLVDEWVKTSKHRQVIGTTFFWDEHVTAKVTGPWGEQIVTTGGDIVLNHQCYDFGDTKTSKPPSSMLFVDTESVVLHELGHLIGLSHVSRKDDRYSAMHPNLYVGEGLFNRSVSDGDKQRIQFLYVENAPVPEVREAGASQEPRPEPTPTLDPDPVPENDSIPCRSSASIVDEVGTFQ